MGGKEKRWGKDTGSASNFAIRGRAKGSKGKRESEKRKRNEKKMRGRRGKG